MSRGVAVVIGAGPAGLTAASELQEHTDLQPVVVERSDQVGGISRTTVHEGNRIDLGGHRFFSKSDRVTEWWLDVLPLEGTDGNDARTTVLEYQRQRRALRLPAGGPDPAVEDRVMLLRRRRSRILHRGRLFDYPLSLDLATLRQLGMLRSARIGASYLRAVARPIRPERTLEEFFVNRFGVELYRSFFRDYTEKVWGVPCHQLPADWGAQRVKGLSISRAVLHAFRRRLAPRATFDQRNSETSLVERFLYPKLGPGQLWDEVARRVEVRGGRVLRRHEVLGIRSEGSRVTAVEVLDRRRGARTVLDADWVISSMPIPSLVRALAPAPPAAVREVAAGLRFRAFFTVGVLLSRLRPLDRSTQAPPAFLPPDTWLYVQEPGLRMGRIQLYNNWSPYLVADPDTIWLGLEYFCSEGDELWRRSDAGLTEIAVGELAAIGLADRRSVLSTTVVRQPKAYPSYTGEYRRLGVVRAFLDGLHNLLPVGRNGMHRYNNQDHSMLAAMEAVACIARGGVGRDTMWAVNADDRSLETAASRHETAGAGSAPAA